MSESNIQGDKSTFLVADTELTANEDEEDFMSRGFQRRLDFNNVEFYGHDSVIVHSQAATTRKQKKLEDEDEEEVMVSNLMESSKQ